MIKVLWIFLIFALTSNTKGFASAIDRSLSIATIPVVSSDCDSTDLYSQHFSVMPAKAGIQLNSPLTRWVGYPSGAWVGCVSSFHPAKKLSTSGSAIASPWSSSLIFNCVSIDSIQQSKVSSNNLSDIFIPPRTSL